MNPIRLKLPATSANLGPGFDAIGLAMGLYLTIDAEVADEFSIEASGRNPELCGALERNLILTTYHDLLGEKAPALRLKLQNEIPLGMGCGSSAAALLAGVFLANHFGGLGMSRQQLLEEACRREGHPDNVAACFYGGLTVSAVVDDKVVATSCGKVTPWRLLLAIPSTSLATEKARALLPAEYSRADAVANIQATGLLVAAFSLGRPDLLAAGMRDRIHQPYRLEACPLLPRLLPLSGTPGIYGVALSGAGPSVLLVTDPEAELRPICEAIWLASGDPKLELVETYVGDGAETQEWAN